MFTFVVLTLAIACLRGNAGDVVQAMEMCDETEHVDVLIVGAGLAGLFAAAKVQDQGSRGRRDPVTFKVLESTDRLGGRYQSEDTIFKNSNGETLHLELGANFMIGKQRQNVPDRSNPIWEMYQGYGYSSVDLNDSLDAYRTDGEEFIRDVVQNEVRAFNRVKSRCIDRSGEDYYYEFAFPEEYDDDMANVDQHVLDIIEDCDDTTWRPDTPLREAIIHSVIEQESGVSVEETSRASFPEGSVDAFTNTHYFPNDPRGSTGLMNEFVDNHVNRDNIVFNASVNSVKEYNVDGGVTTTTATITQEDGSKCTQVYTSDYSIVTASMNVLRSGAIEFESDMEPVLESHPIFNNFVEKVWIQFDEVFWDANVVSVFTAKPLDDTSGSATTFYNYEISHPGSRMLLTFVTDEQRSQMNANGGFDINVLLKEVLSIETYSDSNNFIWSTTDWFGNESTRGAWETWRLGKTFDDWYDAFGPISNLHLAGSAHCLEYWGLTWGAIMNGLYAGSFVVNRIRFPDETLEYQEPYSPCDPDDNFLIEFGRFYRGNRQFFSPVESSESSEPEPTKIGECEEFSDCDVDDDCQDGLLCADEHKSELAEAGFDPRKAYCQFSRSPENAEVCYNPSNI